MDRSSGPTRAAVTARGDQGAAPCPRAVGADGGEESCDEADGGEESCDEDGLGPFRGLVLAAELSAAFWTGTVLLARAVW